MRTEILNELNFITGSPEDIIHIREQSPYAPFAAETIDFLDEISQRIRKSGQARTMSDAASFGFWCRRGNLMKMRERYVYALDRMMGRKVSLHFTPSNVPVMFAFSLAAGLLAGNSVMLRLSQKNTPQCELICEVINSVLEEDPKWKKRIFLFRCGHDKDITDELSLMCDARVIWGGDESVNEIRRSPVPPGAVDVPFAGRKSAAVINARAVIETDDVQTLARNFYNDTYLNDQNACSSPQIIWWTGNKKDTLRAKEKFWAAVYQIVSEKYEVEGAIAVEKLAMACSAAAKLYPSSGRAALREAAFGENIYETGQTHTDGQCGKRAVFMDNLIVRFCMDHLLEDCWEYTAPGGYFIESGGEDIAGLLPALSGKCQTLTVFGEDIESIRKYLIGKRTQGPDRIVPFGQAMEFSLVWDGMDIIKMLSREIG